MAGLVIFVIVCAAGVLLGVLGMLALNRWGP